MKPMKFLLVATLIIFSACCIAFSINDTKKQGNLSETIKPAGFAVVELFTSEGCSSCPAADKLLGEIQNKYKDKPVYVLAYHVDYWDRQGWKDSFSDVAYTNRQFEYSKLLPSQMYTPQAIVNGQTEFIGSDENSLNGSLSQSLSGKAIDTLSISANENGNYFNIDYKYDSNSQSKVLRLAIVQKQAVRHIKRGENEGRTLTHWQIVRSFSTVSLNSTATGTEQMRIPEGFNHNDWEIIGMIQNPKSGKIEAASRALFKTDPLITK